jgi:hypothetical protein
MKPRERILVLKMDCEGCEYSIYTSVMEHDPNFFQRVDQFALEVHLSRVWIHGPKEVFIRMRSSNHKHNSIAITY